MSTEIKTKSAASRIPWNKGHIVGQKRPLRPKEVWAIRVRLQIKHSKRDLAMFKRALKASRPPFPDMIRLSIMPPHLRQSPRLCPSALSPSSPNGRQTVASLSGWTRWEPA
jgi:hypothetical protein